MLKGRFYNSMKFSEFHLWFQLVDLKLQLFAKKSHDLSHTSNYWTFLDACLDNVAYMYM